jgi:hypothetical protein
MTQLPDDLTRGPRRFDSDDAIITARRQGAAIERLLILAEIHAYAKEIRATALPPHIAFAFTELIDEVVNRINALPTVKGE